MSPQDRKMPMMNLIMPLQHIGGHIASWAHPSSWSNTVMNYGQMLEYARIAERAKLDALFIADQNSVIEMDKRALFEAVTPWARPAAFEPLTLLSALSRDTSHIGLVATANTTYDEPYLVARRFASLDHLSNGRSGWNIVTGSFDVDALNFNMTEPPSKADRYARAREFYDVACGLWESWADDAFPEDVEAGMYLDATRVREINHNGRFFQVKGPLNVSRPAQGKPVIFHAGQSPAGRDMAAYSADCVFCVASDKESAMALRTDIHRRAVAIGRDPASIRIMPGASVLPCETIEEVRAIEAELAALISPELGTTYLGQVMNMDLSGFPIDGPMPIAEGDIEGLESFRTAVSAMAQREGLTLRQTYQKVLPGLGHFVMHGTVKDVADTMEDWYRSGACDGFMMVPPLLPLGLEKITDLLIPELQRRGLFRTEYSGGTLRERMGLPIPASSW
jgi:N-acetyl-S-(2-succino)cysteine monooxygenase